MEKQTELKPCPFCGGTNLDVLNVLEENPEYELFGMTKDNWNVVCNSCYGYGGTRRTVFEAIEAWNRRAGDKELK